MKTDPPIFGVWHKYFDATFVIAACILMLTASVINVAHRYQRTRDHVGVRTIVFHDSSDVPHDTEECYIPLCNFVVGHQLAIPSHVCTCTAEGVLPAPWLETLHTPFVDASLQMETIECDIQMMRRGCSVFVPFFSFSFFFSVTVFYVNSLL